MFALEGANSFRTLPAEQVGVAFNDPEDKHITLTQLAAKLEIETTQLKSRFIQQS